MLQRYTFGMCALLDYFSNCSAREASFSIPDVSIKSEVFDDSDGLPFYCVYDAHEAGRSIGFVVEL